MLPVALGADPKAIAELSAGERADAYRLVKASAETEPLSATLGALAPYDRYFEIELFDLIGAPFAGVTTTSLGIERQNARYGLYFLEDLLSVRFFVTNAAFDAVIWTPSLPAALQMYTSEVASVHMDPGSVTVGFVPGAFGLGEGESRAFRLAPFDGSGHSVSLDEPEALAADVGSWLAE
ncbi:MAG: hypothetical protein R3B70_03045 [Polyangiaceae bacterium]